MTGDPMTDRRFKHKGLSPEYESIELMMCRGPTFELAQIQTTLRHLPALRHLFLDSLCRGNEAEGRIAGPSVVMLAHSIACFNCGRVGRISRNCPMLAMNNTGGYTKHGQKDHKKEPSIAKARSEGEGGAGGKRSSVHKSTTNSNNERYQQGEPRPRGNAFTTAALDAHTSPTDDDNNSVFNFSDDSASGVVWIASIKERIFSAQQLLWNPDAGSQQRDSITHSG